MAKLTEEERQERVRGDGAGRNQARRGKPPNITEEETRSEIYKTAYHKAYLSTIASLNITVTAPKSRKKPPSDERLAGVYRAAYESGLKDGFRKAFITMREAPVKVAREQGQWSDQKKSGYQWGYRQAITGYQPHSSGDLRADPEFDAGYKMGYRAGSKVEQELQIA
jgi:hypothetical protein